MVIQGVMAQKNDTLPPCKFGQNWIHEVNVSFDSSRSRPDVGHDTEPSQANCVLLISHVFSCNQRLSNMVEIGNFL